MEDGDRQAGYKHEALPDASTHFRLLKLSIDGPLSQEAFHCTLATFDVRQPPSYDAISYTWGAEPPSQHVSCDGKLIPVRASCIDALRQVWEYGTSQYCWIDVICIDQKNVQEKNKQVRMMKTIFANADHVIACIGPPADDSNYAMMWLDGIERVIMYLGKGNEGYLIWWQDLIRDAARQFTFALGKLTKRSYFRRVWIVEELFLAKRVSFCSGGHRFYIEALMQVLLPLAIMQNQQRKQNTNATRPQMVEHWKPKEGQEEAFQNWIESIQVDHWSPWKDWVFPEGLKDAVAADPDVLDYGTYDMLVRLRDQLKQRTASEKPSEYSYNIFDSIRECAGRQTKDPRDNVYGMFALIDWGDDAPILPNYDKPTFDLALELLRYDLGAKLARQMIINLRVDDQDLSVQRGVLERRHDPDSTEAVYEIDAAEFARGHVTEHLLGQQIIEPYYLVDGDSDTGYRRIMHRNSESCIALACRDARPGDWVVSQPFYGLNSIPYKDNLSFPGLVLRKSNTAFAIVGQATMGEDRGTDWFNVHFDPEDFLIYAATSQLIEMNLRDLQHGKNEPPTVVIHKLCTRICKKGALSSVAVLRDHQKDPWAYHRTDAEETTAKQQSQNFKDIMAIAEPKNSGELSVLAINSAGLLMPR